MQFTVDCVIFRTGLSVHAHVHPLEKFQQAFVTGKENARAPRLNTVDELAKGLRAKWKHVLVACTAQVKQLKSL